MDIGDIIRMITSGGDPNAAIMNAQGAMPQAQPAPQQAQPASGAPQGVQTPVTNPQPSAAAPTVTQSPPDLANMYIKLMEKNQNAARLDSGLSLIAAGLSNSPTNRAALISASGGGHGAGGMSMSANDFINFEKQKQAQQDVLLRRQALPALIKQYNLTPAQAQYLETSGQLPDVLKHYSTENLGVTENAENGQKTLFNPRTGKTVATVGGEKEEEGTWVEGPQGKVLRSSRTGEAMGQPAGLPPDKIEVTRSDGSKVIVDKSTTESGAVVAPPRKIGDEIPAVTNELHQINKDRAMRGEDPLTAEQLIKLKQTPPNQINVGTDGSAHPKPPDGYDYKRDPATGKILVDEKGEVSYYKIKEGKPADEAIVKVEEKAKEAKKEASAQRLKMASTSAIVQSANRAMDIIDKAPAYLPAAGFGQSIGGMFGGTPTSNLKPFLAEINAGTAFAQLKAMREASTSGASGLGQVTDFEQRMLSSATGNLDPNQSPPQLKRQLRKVQAAMMVLAENSFDEKDAAAYDKALNAKIAELEGEVKGSKSTAKRVK